MKNTIDKIMLEASAYNRSTEVIEYANNLIDLFDFGILESYNIAYNVLIESYNKNKS